MAVVELSFPARPAHVRTARLIAGALARRAELAEDIHDEIRLAVAEACGVALSILAPSGLDRLVAVDFDDSDGLTVEVRADVPLSAANGADALGVVAEAARVVGVGDGDGLPVGAALAVLAELAPVLDAATSEQGMRLTLGWPAEPV